MWRFPRFFGDACARASPQYSVSLSLRILAAIVAKQKNRECRAVVPASQLHSSVPAKSSRRLEFRHRIRSASTAQRALTSTSYKTADGCKAGWPNAPIFARRVSRQWGVCEATYIQHPTWLRPRICFWDTTLAIASSPCGVSRRTGQSSIVNGQSSMVCSTVDFIGMRVVW